LLGRATPPRYLVVADRLIAFNFLLQSDEDRLYSLDGAVLIKIKEITWQGQGVILLQLYMLYSETSVTGGELVEFRAPPSLDLIGRHGFDFLCVCMCSIWTLPRDGSLLLVHSW